jgi:hypothetical protein
MKDNKAPVINKRLAYTQLRDSICQVKISWDKSDTQNHCIDQLSINELNMDRKKLPDSMTEKIEQNESSQALFEKIEGFVIDAERKFISKGLSTRHLKYFIFTAL